MSFSEDARCEELVAAGLELADIARSLLAGFRSGAAFETKEDASPVTEFDRDVETRLRDYIQRRFPEHGIIGEEFEDVNADAEFAWVLDPIDGTKSFATGIPVFTTLIALCQDGKPVVGIIDAPVTGERWLGIEGRDTTLNGDLVRTSGRDSLDGATVAWSNPESVLPEHAAGRDVLNERSAWRVFGAGSYAFGRLAEGALDVAIESGAVGEVDICALVPVVNGAGGKCTDGFGRPITYRSQLSCVAAASPELHAETIRVLNGE